MELRFEREVDGVGVLDIMAERAASERRAGDTLGDTVLVLAPARALSLDGHSRPGVPTTYMLPCCDPILQYNLMIQMMASVHLRATVLSTNTSNFFHLILILREVRQLQSEQRNDHVPSHSSLLFRRWLPWFPVANLPK